ncbi:MAG: LamG domain-containing protein [Planctomycetota bacterium]|jgi:hypothetical protein
MKRRTAIATITMILIAMYGGVSVHAAPEISFVPPTPFDGQIVNSSSVEIEVQITESALADLTFHWNGKDYLIHDDSTVLMFNFDNVAALGENYKNPGDLVKDVSEWDNDGTLGIGDDPTTVPEWLFNGYYGGAFDFAGNGSTFGQSILVIPHDSSLVPNGGDFAIAVWVRPRSDIDGDIIRKGSTQTASTWYKLEHSPGTSNNRFSLNFNTDGTDATVNSPQAYNDDQWHFVVAQRNGNKAELWIDGAMVGSTGVSGSIYNTANLTVGSKDDQDDDFINATLDEVRLYMRCFTEDEMQILYNSNLSKAGLDTWFFYVNKTNLTSGNYIYHASATNFASQTSTAGPRNVTIDAPPISYDIVANADIRVAGTVSGSYFDTQSNDNDYEAITERESGGKPSNRYSYLEHKWTFNVPSGDTMTFHVNAYKSPNNEDDFVFAYSKDDYNYENMVIVTKTSDDVYQSSAIPSITAGTVYVRVVDTDRSEGNKSLDTIYVDDMYITSASGGDPDTEPPAPDPMTWAIPPYATSGTSISMTATTAYDSSGVEYYFEETSGNAGGSDSGWQYSPTYEDTGLQPNTSYSYQVKARDKSTNNNETGLSAEMFATTPTAALPGQATNPIPFDGQSDINRKSVILNWTAGSGATSHDIYLGTSAGLGPESFKGNQTSTSYEPSVLRKGTTYYWRIDEVNSDGTTTGAVWNFTTL